MGNQGQQLEQNESMLLIIILVNIIIKENEKACKITDLQECSD